MSLGIISVSPLQARISLCNWAPWELSACKAIATYADGTKRETAFYPEGKTVPTCYSFGCNPYYCDNWRDSIRNICKTEYQATKAKAAGFFIGAEQPQEVVFEGCAVHPKAGGILVAADWFVRKYGPSFYSTLCTTYSPEQEKSLKQYGKELWEAGLRWTQEHLPQNTTTQAPPQDMSTFRRAVEILSGLGATPKYR